MTGTETYIIDWQESHNNIQTRLRIVETWDDSTNQSSFDFYLDVKADNPPVSDYLAVYLQMSWGETVIVSSEGALPAGVTISGDWAQGALLGSLSGVEHNADGTLTLSLDIEPGATTRVCRVLCSSYTGWFSAIATGTEIIHCHTIQAGLCRIAYGEAFYPAEAYIAAGGQFMRGIPYIARNGAWEKGI